MMGRHNLGFGVFLAFLLLAPEIPVRTLGLPGTEQTTLSLGFIGLGIWLFLSMSVVSPLFYLPIGLYVIAALHGFFVALASTTMGSIMFGAQYLYYVVIGSLLIPAYFMNRLQRGRVEDCVSVFGWFCCIYLLAIIVSSWIGPIYPHQVTVESRMYEGLRSQRGIGFAQSANIAGAVAVVMAAFLAFVFARSIKSGFVLIPLGLAGLIAPLSRGAILSFAFAMAALAALLIIHAVFAMRVRIGAINWLIRSAVLLSVAGSGLVLFLVADTSISRDLQRRILGLGLDSAVAEHDLDARRRIMEYSLLRWQKKAGAELLLGSGFRNTSDAAAQTGVQVTSHNAYIELLNDNGLLGLGLFLGVLLVSVARLAVSIVVDGGNRIKNFCFVAIVGLAIDNVSQVFFYHPTVIAMLLISLTIAALHREIADQLHRPPGTVAASGIQPGMVAIRRLATAERASK